MAEPLSSDATPSSSPPRPARRTGKVVPHQPAWHQRILARLIWAVVRGVAATMRFRLDESRKALPVEADGPMIICVWHNRLSLSMIVYEKWFRGVCPGRRMAALVSASRDGAMLARVLELFGVQPVRGSSSRRGAQALLELTTWAERGLDLAITPDGPRGPCYRVQEGVIALAQLTGRMVLPVSINLSRKMQARSWDRFQIPLPFSRAEIVLGEPLRVPQDAGDEGREEIRRKLEERLLDLTRD